MKDFAIEISFVKGSREYQTTMLEVHAVLLSFQFVSLHLNIPPKWGYFYPAATKLQKECTEHKIPPGICCSCLTSPFLSCNKRKIISFIIIQLSSTKKSMYHRYGCTSINFKFNDLHLQFTFQLDSTSFL